MNWNNGHRHGYVILRVFCYEIWSHMCSLLCYSISKCLILTIWFRYFWFICDCIWFLCCVYYCYSVCFHEDGENLIWLCLHKIDNNSFCTSIVIIKLELISHCNLWLRTKIVFSERTLLHIIVFFQVYRSSNLTLDKSTSGTLHYN